MLSQIIDKDSKIVGYKITRSTCPGWCFVGTSPEEIAAALRDELDMEEGLSAEERDEITLVPYETTQAEIDALPEFQGW